MGWLIAALLVYLAGFGSATYFKNIEIAASEKHAADLQQQIEAKADALKQEQENHVQDMQTAFEAGQKSIEPVVKTVYVKGAQYASADKGISNPVCVMGADSLHFLNLARSDVRAAASAGGPSNGLPRSATDNGPVVREPVPTVDQRRGAIPTVSGQPTPLPSARGVSGSSVSAHPKPTPIGK